MSKEKDLNENTAQPDATGALCSASQSHEPPASEAEGLIRLRNVRSGAAKQTLFSLLWVIVLDLATFGGFLTWHTKMVEVSGIVYPGLENSSWL